MGKKIVAVNASPRRGWNTDTLINEAIRGAESKDAEVIKFDLYRLEKFTGCVSCFGCKKQKYKGRCIHKDSLTPVLDTIRHADALIIGSPNYLSDLSSGFRALYERLVFQNLTYNKDNPCCNSHMIPVLLIMTSNAPDGRYNDLLEGYKKTLERYVGQTEIFVCGDTMQIKDYSKTEWEWSYFNPDEKLIRHRTIFPEEKKEAFEKGVQLAK